MPKPLYLVGAGGHGSVVLDALLADGVVVEGIVDPALAPGSSRLGVPVLGGDEFLDTLVPSMTLLALGVGAVPGDDTRIRLHAAFKKRGFNLASVRHPRAVIGGEVFIGEGCQMMAGAILQSGVIADEGCVVNTGACVDHDSRIGAHAFIAPGVILCGGVVIGERAFIGAGAVILPGIKIGTAAIVAAGAVVIRSVPCGEVVAGNPAVALKKSKSESR